MNQNTEWGVGRLSAYTLAIGMMSATSAVIAQDAAVPAAEPAPAASAPAPAADAANR